MKKYAIGFVMASILISSTSFADDKKFKVGMQMDVGAPDGANVGVSVKPYFNWLRLNMSVGHNALAFGYRGSITLDPFKFPIGLTLTGDVGHYTDGQIPGVSNSPTIGYNYFNLQPGLEIGKRDSWRIFLRGGVSWIDLHANNIKQFANVSDNNLYVGDPNANVRFFPTAKFGFFTYF